MLFESTEAHVVHHKHSTPIFVKCYYVDVGTHKESGDPNGDDWKVQTYS